MRVSTTLITLAWCVAILAAIASAAGVFWPAFGNSFTFTSLHGQPVEILGAGLYRNDSLLIGLGFRGTDAVTLFLHVPVLLFATLLYRQGSLRGGLLLTGMLAYFLYYYASMAFGAAYNPLFIVYVALFATSLFAFFVAMSRFDWMLPLRFSKHLPVAGISNFLFFVGLALTFVWLPAIVSELVSGRVPALVGSYTTAVTWVLDLGVIVPAAFVAAVQLRRRTPLGLLLSATLLVLCVAIGVSLMAQGTSQLVGGVQFTAREMISYMLPFVLLTAVGIWPLVALFRNVRALPVAVENATLPLRVAKAG